jgi:cyclophilin family peptidyl-prolyl cis-trans isomerase
MRFFVFLLFFQGLVLSTHAAPLAPSGLTAVATGYSTIALSWTDNSSDEAGFIIGIRIPPTATFSILDYFAPGTTSVNLTGATGNTTYDFVVVAYDAANAQSAFSNVATVTTPVGITSPSFRAATLLEAFSLNLTSSNPNIVTGYAITALPPGLTLNPSTGLISGTPTVSGKTTGQVTITHSGGLTATAPLTIRVFVNPPPLAPPVAGPALQNLSLNAGGAPVAVSLTDLFTDPDVSSAVRLTTDLGPVDFAFYPGSAPATVANFLGYLNRGDFINTIFHRSVPGFIIQAGAFRADATASAVTTQLPVVNEPNISNRRGTVAMAKLGGNPDSATNQFFVNLADNSSNLDNQNEGFTVFARVAGNGMSVADAIAALTTRNYTSVNGALTDTPVRGVPPATYNPAALVRINGASVVAPLGLSASSSQPSVASVTLTGTNLTLSPLAPGTTVITLTATDLDNLTATSSFEVTVRETYDYWASNQTFATPADATPDADPDADGLPNLLEYALGGLPLAPSAALAPVLARDPATSALTLSYTRARADVTYAVETTTTLANPASWTTVGVTQGDPDAHGFTTASVPHSSGPRFLRLRVALVP